MAYLPKFITDWFKPVPPTPVRKKDISAPIFDLVEAIKSEYLRFERDSLLIKSGVRDTSNPAQTYRITFTDKLLRFTLSWYVGNYTYEGNGSLRTKMFKGFPISDQDNSSWLTCDEIELIEATYKESDRLYKLEHNRKLREEASKIYSNGVEFNV